MELTIADFQLFERDLFTFKQLKEYKTAEEIEQIKIDYKTRWQRWKTLQLQVAEQLPAEFRISKPKIESWTNGWNLRNHFWSAYRSSECQNENACLAVLLNRKQYQIYLMFQHYKSEKRTGSSEEYNQLLERLPEWSRQVDLTDYYIWPQVEHELTDHLPLSVYLADEKKQVELKKALAGKTFQIGKLLFKTKQVPDVEQVTVATLRELAPLYFSL
ncbi:hypothetical protein GIX45_25890 [Erwinia sp. CPCC 100877]|nr:hypothetical protein [Erwinia sp. CPCC 100877]